MRIELPEQITLKQYIIHSVFSETFFDVSFPRDFKLYGSNDNINFNIIDSQTNVDWNRNTDTDPLPPPQNRCVKVFNLPSNTTPYKTYTLLVSSVGSTSPSSSQSPTMRIVELELYADNPTNTRVNIGNPNVFFHYLPTRDPKFEGQLWNDDGTLKISSGI